MRTVRGFALLLSLLLVLILTVFAFGMLLLAQDHYAATKMLHDSEKARLICESATWHLVQQHNVESPRFFLDPVAWNGISMKPFLWNGYRITGNLAAPWTSADVNWIQLGAQRARSFAKLDVPLEQIRLEHFALFSDEPQTLTTSGLFAGLVFVRDGLTLNQFVRFRESVHTEVSPSHYASYRKSTSAPLAFPALNEIVSFPEGLAIMEKDPRFWVGDHYELDLDELKLTAKQTRWEIQYKGSTLGETSFLVIAFDDVVHVFQRYSEILHLPSNRPHTPLYIRSSKDVVIESSLQTVQQTHDHPLLIEAANTIRIVPESFAIRIQACLIARGDASLAVEPGSRSIGPAEQQSWTAEINGSIFIMEPQKREELLQALSRGQKLVWFRGSIGVHGAIAAAPDVVQLHFQSAEGSYRLLSSFPFVRFVEGRQRWH